MHQLQQMQDKAKESCMTSFRLLHSHLKVFSIKEGFERACVALFDQDKQNFTESLLLNLEHLEKKLDREEFQETESINSFRVLMEQFQTFINFRYYFDDFDGAMIRKSFLEYTRTEIQQFRATLIQHMESVKKSIDARAQHKREYDRRVNDRVMQSKEGKVDSSKALDAGLVITKSNVTESERHVSSSRSGNDTHVEDADINSVNDKEPMAEVQLTAQHNVLANVQQHSVQSEPIYDTHLLEKVDSNTTPNSTNMCHRREEIDQNAEKCQVSCPLLDPSFDNMTTEFSNQSLESENISLKKTRVQTKDLNDSLIAQINSKTVKNADLKAQIQEKVFANVALKNELKKLKGNSVDTKESVSAKPHHVIAPGSSRNSSKESYGSNDMAHNYYLEEDKKKTQDKNRNLKPRKMPSAKTHNTPNACTPKPRSNNQTSRNWPASKSCEETLKAMQKADHSRNPSSFSDFKHFVCSTCQKCVFNANHDACITKFLKEVNSRAKIQPNKTRNSNKPVDPTSHT
ncbi:hypothetical protein Tco_0580123 [Tanacetum coccineum]